MFIRHSMMNLQGMLCLSIYSREKCLRSVARNTGMSVDTINKYIAQIEYSSGRKIFNHHNNKLQLTEYGKYIAVLGKKIENILQEAYKNEQGDDRAVFEAQNFINISLNGMEMKFDTSSAILAYNQLKGALYRDE